MQSTLTLLLTFLSLSLPRYSFSFCPIQTRISHPISHHDAAISTVKSSLSNKRLSATHFPTHSKKIIKEKLTSLFESNGGDDTISSGTADPLIRNVAIRLRRAYWTSWWAQVILTVISSVTLLFARSVMNAVKTNSSGQTVQTAPGGFFFAGSGIALSYLSIIWTWGGTRLSRRLRRNSTKPYSRIKAANTIRRAVTIGAALNLLGMLVTLIGAEQIVGLLSAKILTMQGVTPFGGGVGSLGLTTQSIQPLDILIVQANTNTLLSHFLSLGCCLILTRSVHLLDPPSVEEDER